MANDIFHIESITQLHRTLGFPDPLHPLISVLRVEEMKKPEDFKNKWFSSDFYSISLKDGSCGMQYGRNYYDFEAGVLSFMAPKQVMRSDGTPSEAEGWMLLFHPDLIRHSQLGRTIDSFTFFSYEVHEALHLSQREQDLISDIVEKIKYEYQQNIDAHSQDIFVSHLDLLLNYSRRFYERQFHTRKKQNVDVVSQVERLLRDYYSQGQQLENGMPSIAYLAEKVHLSSNYLSDLLKKETGRNGKDHVHEYVIERAKTLLLNSTGNISEIAYDLGFNYPHYFSRMFKQKTGMTPVQYREHATNA